MKWIFLCCGVLLGIAIVTFVVCKVTKNKGPKEPARNSFDELIRDQMLFDSLDVKNLLSWFHGNASKAKGGAVFFLARPTKKMATMLNLTNRPADLDTTHNLLQAVVDKRENLPVAVRMVSFSSISEKLEKRLNASDYLIIEPEDLQ